MSEDERKKIFCCRVLAWREIKDSHGSWDKAAKFYKITEHELMRHCLDDLQEVWGEKLEWEKAFT